MNDTINYVDEMNVLDLYSLLFGILLSILFVIGIIGNLSVCIVIFRNTSMHTSTNCYLFTLAICDILIILCELKAWIVATFGMTEEIFGRPLCLIEVFTAEIAIYCGLLIVTAVSVTRYLVICHPLRPHDMINDIAKTIKFIIIAWMFASCLAVPSAIRFVDHCNTERLEIIISDKYKFIASLWALILYLSLMIFIAILYILIGRELMRSNKSAHPNTVIDRENRKVIKMLVTVIIALFLCWTPLQVFKPIFYYLSMYTTSPQKLNDISAFVEIPSGLLFYCTSTTINPILYNMMSDKFREAFKKTICWRNEDRVTGRTATSKTECESISLGTKSCE